MNSAGLQSFFATVGAFLIRNFGIAKSDALQLLGGFMTPTFYILIGVVLGIGITMLAEALFTRKPRDEVRVIGPDRERVAQVSVSFHRPDF
jgi:uncharacterized membrane protein